MTATAVTIRGHGSGRVWRGDPEHLVVDCPCRLLPGRPYVVQGLGHGVENRRMRVISSSVQALHGDAGVVYRVTFRPDA